MPPTVLVSYRLAEPLRSGWVLADRAARMREEPYSAVVAAGSGCAVFGFDAMLAEQGMKALDFVAELAELLGEGRQVRMRGCPLLLARGLLSKQVPFPGRAATRPAHTPGRRRRRAGRAAPARSAGPVRRCPARSLRAARPRTGASRSRRGGRQSPAGARVLAGPRLSPPAHRPGGHEATGSPAGAHGPGPRRA
jgi:hypothetical protein